MRETRTTRVGLIFARARNRKLYHRGRQRRQNSHQDQFEDAAAFLGPMIAKNALGASTAA
jgi:hypothetical protein